MTYEPLKLEKRIMNFWEKNRIYQRLRKRGKKKFFYMDGPPYANGDPHLGHILNRTHKDMIRRYKWMNGYKVWDQPGFDCHGLPIETAVEKKFGLNNKEDILKFGEGRFVKECIKLASDNVKKMGEIFKRYGEWATWDNPYRTMDDSFIESVWWAMKELWKNNLLYKGKKVLHWCPRCGTALALNYEIVYEKLTDKSIYVKFPVKGRDNEFLIIWTTTPWTIPFNLAVMVHPDFDYVKIQKGTEKWVVAKELADKFGDFEVLEQIKGRNLEGVEYWHPFFTEIPYFSKKSKWMHKIVLSSEYVTLDAGSGLVHCAPGCGPEDFEIGKKYGLKPFNTVDENGYLRDIGPLSGLKAREDDEKIIGLLGEKGLLVKEEKIIHDYPVCERCKTPVIFRATEQWFLKATKAKKKMLQENKKVHWIPEWVGERRFANWLENIKDWCISRQRYWGIPLPIWECDKCGKIEVIGSKEELNKKPKNLHKPDIDEITWKCKCGGQFKRNPDVLDVWIDSACVPFASLGYPRKKELFERLYPADFIIESHDQIRGWFYSLMTINTFLFGKRPYEKVYMHGYVMNERGEKMSKRLGNFISVKQILEKYGADLFRMAVMSSSIPGLDINFGEDMLKEAYKTLNTLWNIKELMKKASKLHKIKMEEKMCVEEEEDRWIISKINSLVFDITDYMEKYILSEPGKLVKEFILEDFSRWYGKLVRDRLFNKGKKEAKKVLDNMYYVMKRLLLVSCPIMPHITEGIFRELDMGESVHLEKWPEADKKLISAELEGDMKKVRKVVQAIMSLRDKEKIGLRWPVENVIIVSENKVLKKLEKLKKIIEEQANVMNIHLREEHPETEMSFKFNYNNLKRYGDRVAVIISKLMGSEPRTIREKAEKGELFVGDMELTKEDFIFEMKSDKYAIIEMDLGVLYMDREMSKNAMEKGYVREITRRIQQQRKEMGLERGDFVVVKIEGEKDIINAIKNNRDEIEKKTNSRVEFGKGDKKFKIRDREVGISVLSEKIPYQNTHTIGEI